MALIGISIVPILFISIIFRLESKKDIQNKYLILFDKTMRETSNHMSAQIQTIVNILDEVMVDQSVQDNLRNFNEEDSFGRYTIATDLRAAIYTDPVMSNYINIFEVLTNTDVYFYNYGFDELDDETRKSIKKKAYDLKGQIYYGVSPIDGEILISRVINWRFTGVPMGYIIMTVPNNYFSEVLNGYDGLHDDIRMLLVDKNGLILSSNKSAFVGEYFENQVLLKASIEGYQDAFLPVQDENNYHIITTNLPNSEFYLISMIPDAYLNQEASELGNIILVLMIVAVTLAIIIALVLTKAIFKPIHQLVDIMKGTNSGKDLKAHYHYKKKDEIGYLVDNFNDMLVRIQTLITKLEIEERDKREAEMSMLQAQINPHFLFNVLNSLKWTANMSQSYSVAEGLDALSNLLRDTIVNKNQFVSLENEIENIEHYMTIQQIRYGDNFRLDNQLPKRFFDYQIPKLLLQPIVENSIIHGFDQIEYEGVITIKGRVEEASLILDIIDNGKGIKKPVVVDHHKKKQLTSIGLENVRQRIKLHFGEDFDLKMDNLEQGMKVTLKLPFVEAGEHV